MVKERINAPEPFEKVMLGEEGSYKLTYEPYDEWDGVIETVIADIEMSWYVENIERDEAGVFYLSGISNTKDVWGDSYWFVLTCAPNAAKIEYWGNEVLYRTDYGS